MPKSILDHGSPEAMKQFAALDSFTQGYIEAMFFTSEGVDNDCEPGHENDLADISFNDMAPESIAAVAEECAAFQLDNATLLGRAYELGEAQSCYDETRAGHDYWYTRNGHGTGYWDRGLGEVGEQLAEATRYSARYLYRGDDGRLYVT